MSEENNSEQSSESSEQVSESTDQSVSTSTEGTQQVNTDSQVDASTSIETKGSEVGLVKPEVESVDSGEAFSQSLDGLVQDALNGNLTDEQREMLDKQGLGGHFDMIVSGHQAVIAKNDAEIVDVVGGKEAYGELQEWAIANLSDEEIESYNMAVLESGNIGLAKLAVEGLQARYQRVNGQAPEKRIEAGGSANEATRPYSSRDEYISEYMSQKYQQDPEYAAQVEAKRNLSGF